MNSIIKTMGSLKDLMNILSSQQQSFSSEADPEYFRDHYISASVLPCNLKTRIR